MKLLKEAQPDQSEAQWTICTKWCHSNQVDVGAPPNKSIADFLLYLFKDRKLQLSTTDGLHISHYKLESSPINIRKDENLTRLLDSFIETGPRVIGESPPEIFPWCFNNLQRLLLKPLKRPP